MSEQTTRPSLSDEEQRILNHLASMPRYANASATREQVRSIMLNTTGWLLAAGYQYDIVSEPLGAGVYRLSLVPRLSVQPTEKRP